MVAYDRSYGIKSEYQVSRFKQTTYSKPSKPVQYIPIARVHIEPRYTDLMAKVQSAVCEALGTNTPTLSSIASKLGIGTRTLQRRLYSNGHSFQNIVDLARKDVARHLLSETDLCLAEIAFLTGFSEQSAFSRAFKRWVGQTPRSYRLKTSSMCNSKIDATGRKSGASKTERNARFLAN
jgi:AraC-like DNA-binding protein